MVVEHKGQKAFWKPDQEKACEGQWGDGKNDFLEEDDTEDDSEDGYSNLNSRGSSTWCS